MQLLALPEQVLASTFASKQEWSATINLWADEAEKWRKKAGNSKDERSSLLRKYAIQFRQDTSSLLGWLDYGHACADHLKAAKAHILETVSAQT